MKKWAGWTEGRQVYYIFFCLLIFLSFLIGAFKISSNDTWWHIKTGELILSSGIPHTDPFSFTAHGNHWVTHEWLAEVIFYLLYKLGGVTGLIAFKGIVTAVIAFIIFDFGDKNKIAPALSASTALFTITALSYMMYVRPHIFSFLFLAILLYLLFGPRKTGKALKIERWVIIPGILWLWANMHAGFILGIGVYGLIVAREIILPAEKRIAFANRFKQSGLPLVFASLLCLINPNGIAIYTYPFMISSTPAFKSGIGEWVSPIYLGSSEWLAKTILYFMSALGVGLALWHLKRRLDITLILLSVGVMAWLAMRNVQNFAIVMAMALLAAPWGEVSKKIRIQDSVKIALQFIGVIWIAALFILIRGYQKDNGRLGWGIQADLSPVGACDFLKRINFDGNIVNTLSDGGYLIWAGYPQWKVFVDGRLDVYGEAQINEYRRVIEGSPDALDIFDKLGAAAALLPMPPLIGAVRNQLSRDNRWMLVYFDDYWLLYLRKGGRNQAALNAWGYSVINPLVSGYGYNREQADLFDSEAKRALEIAPQSSLANILFGFASQGRNENLKAIGYYRAAIDIKPDLNQYYRIIGEAYAQINAIDSALVWLERAGKISPADPWVYYDLGMTYGRMNDLVMAEFYFNEALKRDPNSPARQWLEKIRQNRGGTR